MRLIDQLVPRAALLDEYVSADKKVELPRKAVPFIWHFVCVLKLPIGLITLLFTVNAILTTLEPLFAGWMVSVLSQTTPGQVWKAIAPPLLLYLLLCQLLVRIVVNNAHRLQNYVSPVLGMLVRNRLAGYLYNHSYRYFQEDMAGRLAGKVMEMPEAVKLTVYDTLDTLIYLVFVAATSTVLFVRISPWLALISAIYICLTVLLARWRIPGYTHSSAISAESQQAMRGRYIDGIANILIVKLFAREPHEKSLLSEALIAAGTAEQAQGQLERVWYQKQHILNGAMQSSVALVAVVLFQQQKIAIGQFATAITLSIAFAGNVWYMMNFASHFFARFGVIDNALATILESQEVIDAPDAVPLPKGRGDIALDKVVFAYPGRPVFTGFSLDIPAGQKVGLVGPSGAGKSTLMQLLLRLADIQEGSIRIAGQDIREVRQGDLRRAITVIPQATELMHRSIRDNILYGDPEAGDERMIAAAKSAFIHETIESLSDQHGNRGYDALVGERGVKLSGGQRQRIAIARAFLKDAPILVLDEATSALDSESERLIQTSFVELFAGRTVIAIAHRLSTIAHLDRIVVLDQGKVVEDGPHAELIGHGGLYARLWALQSGGFIGDGHLHEGRPH